MSIMPNRANIFSLPPVSEREFFAKYRIAWEGRLEVPDLQGNNVQFGTRSHSASRFGSRFGKTTMWLLGSYDLHQLQSPAENLSASRRER